MIDWLSTGLDLDISASTNGSISINFLAKTTTLIQVWDPHPAHGSISTTGFFISAVHRPRLFKVQDQRMKTVWNTSWHVCNKILPNICLTFFIPDFFITN